MLNYRSKAIISTSSNICGQNHPQLTYISAGSWKTPKTKLDKSTPVVFSDVGNVGAWGNKDENFRQQFGLS